MHPDIGKRWPIPKVTFALLNSKQILHKNPTDFLFHECRRTLVCHLDPRDVAVGLCVDPVQGLVLPVEGGVHVV